MTVPHTLEDSLHLHETAVMKWLRTMRVNYGKVLGESRKDEKMIVVNTMGTRVAQDVYSMLVRDKWIKEVPEEARKNTAKLMDVLPLPFMTVYGAFPEIATDRERVANTTVQRATKYLAGAGKIYPYPRADYLNIDVSLYCAIKPDLDYVWGWLRPQLGVEGANKTELWLRVKHVAPFGLVKQPMKFNGGSDDSDLEGDRTRVLRYTFRFNLLAWMFLPPLKNEDGTDKEVWATIGPSVSMQHTGLQAFDVPVQTTQEDLLARGRVIGARTLYTPQTYESPNLFVDAENPLQPTASLTASGSRYADWNPAYVNSPGMPISTPGAIQYRYKEEGDKVTLSEVPVVGPENDIRPFRFAMTYMASDDHVLKAVGYNTQDQELPIYRWTVPKALAWTKFQKLFVAPCNVASLLQFTAERCQSITGVIQKVDYRCIFPVETIKPFKATNGPDAVYWWRVPRSEQYAILVVPEAPKTSFEFTVDNVGFGTPTLTQRQVYNPDTMFGAVAVVTPIADSFRIKIPKSVPVKVMAFAYPVTAVGDGLPL